MSSNHDFLCNDKIMSYGSQEKYIVYIALLVYPKYPVHVYICEILYQQKYVSQIKVKGLIS